MPTTRSRSRSRARTLAATIAAGALTVTLPNPAAASGTTGGTAAGGPVAVALTEGNRLVSFDTYATAKATNDVAITGLAPTEVLVGLDRRPKDGVLYAVARSPQATRLYAVDAASGRATAVADLVTTAGAPIVLLGASFGVDFNPAADALRIVSDGGQNLRILPSERTVENVVRPAGTTFVDGTLNEGGLAATGVSAAAYTQSDNDPATATKLYVLDADDNRLLVQDPPNAGTLGSGVRVAVRGSAIASLDSLTLGGADYAYATVSRDAWGTTKLVKVDLGSGQVRELGRIPTKDAVRGIAL